MIWFFELWFWFIFKNSIRVWKQLFWYSEAIQAKTWSLVLRKFVFKVQSKIGLWILKHRYIKYRKESISLERLRQVLAKNTLKHREAQPWFRRLRISFSREPIRTLFVLTLILQSTKQTVFNFYSIFQETPLQPSSHFSPSPNLC